MGGRKKEEGDEDEGEGEGGVLKGWVLLDLRRRCGRGYFLTMMLHTALAGVFGVGGSAIVGGWCGRVMRMGWVIALLGGSGLAAESAKEFEAYLERGREALEGGNVEEAKTLMELALAHWKGQKREAQEDARMARLRAQILFVLGSAMVAELEEEEELDEAQAKEAREVFLEACALFEKLRQKQPDDPTLIWESSESHQYVAALHDALEDGDSRDAFMGKAMTMLQDGLRARPKDPLVRRRLANLIVADIVANNYYLVELAERKAVIQETVDLLEGLVAENPEDLELKGELGMALPWLAHAGGGADDAVLERAAWQRNMQIWDELAAKLPDNEDVLTRKAGARSGMAGFERDAENFERSIQLHLEARAIRSELAKKNPENIDLQYGLASDWHVIGVVAERAGDLAEARRYYQLALTDYEKLAAEHPGETDAEEHIVLVHRLIGDLASEEDRWPEAQAAYRKAMRRAEELMDLSSASGLREVAELWMHAAGRAKVHGDPAFLKEAFPQMLALLEKYQKVTKNQDTAYTLLIQAHLEAAGFAREQQKSAEEKRFLERAFKLFDEAQAKGLELEDEELEEAVEAERRKGDAGVGKE